MCGIDLMILVFASCFLFIMFGYAITRTIQTFWQQMNEALVYFERLQKFSYTIYCFFSAILVVTFMVITATFGYFLNIKYPIGISHIYMLHICALIGAVWRIVECRLPNKEH